MQKYVNLVDLVKSFPTRIYLMKSALIQPRTSPSKFGGKFNSLFTSLLSPETPGAPGPALPQKVPLRYPRLRLGETFPLVPGVEQPSLRRFSSPRSVSKRADSEHCQAGSRSDLLHLVQDDLGSLLLPDLFATASGHGFWLVFRSKQGWKRTLNVVGLYSRALNVQSFGKQPTREPPLGSNQQLCRTM